MFNCGTGRAPTYLMELLSKRVNRRQGLKSASDPGIRYDIPFNKKTRFDDRIFCTIGPILWNNLPLYIKQSVSIDVLRITSKLTILYSFMTYFKIDSHFYFLSVLELLYFYILQLLRSVIYRIYIYYVSHF